jgi:MFS family permease
VGGDYRPNLRGLGALTAYWVGLSVLWGAMLTVVEPQLVQELVPPEVKTTALTLLFGVQAIVSILVQPLAGAASDRLVTPWGRRRPLLVAGAAAQVVLLVALMFAGSFTGVLIVLIFAEVASNVAQGSYQGLLPDCVPVEGRGVASGLLGGGSLAGQIVGVAVAGAALVLGDTNLAIAFSAAAVGLGTVGTVIGVPERLGRTVNANHRVVVDWARHLLSRRSWVGPARAMILEVWGRDVLEHRDYLWLLASRLLILMATGSLQPFVLYYLQDSLGLGADAAAAVTPIAGAVALVALVSAVPGGAATARWGRVRTVFVSAVTGGVGAFLFAIAPTYAFLFVVAIPFGVALGVFLSADWALLVEVAPQEEEGRYLGLSNTVTASATVLAVVVAGPIADVLNGVSVGLGYRAAFIIAALEFLVGAWCVLHVHEPHRAPQAESPVPAGQSDT